MEKTISELKASGLEIRLTNERLYFNSTASQETMALRSVNGVAIVDLIDDYNAKLTAYKTAKNASYVNFVLGFGFAIGGVFLQLELENPILIVLGVAYLIFAMYTAGKIQEPTLMSLVRIHTNGGARDFEFDKKGVYSGNVAEFVARIEDTLTAFHKNS